MQPVAGLMDGEGQMLEMLALGNLAREADAGDAFACKDALVTDCRRRRDGRQGQPVRKNCCASKRLEKEFQEIILYFSCDWKKKGGGN